jgi:hypothetical protein
LVKRNDVAVEASVALRQYTLLAPSKLNDTAPEPVTAAAVMCARACVHKTGR